MIAKLISIQSELTVPKNQYNSFGGYKYRSCEDILEAVKPLLAKNGLLLTMNDEVVEIGGRNYVKATLKITDGTKEMEYTAFAREEEIKKGMDGSQITGASSSYARKYALNGLFLIDDTKDSDATNIGESPKKQVSANATQLASEKQRGFIYSLYKTKNGEEMPEEEKEKIRKLTKTQASDLIEKWQSEPKPPVAEQSDDEILNDPSFKASFDKE